jgi:hypothetical protein
VNQKLAKEQRRNLKHAIGETAASAVAGARLVADQSANEVRIIAKQMLQVELQLSAVREARAVDKNAIAGLQEQLQNVAARIDAERTHRLELAAQQRRYVDDADQRLDRRLQRLERLSWRGRLRFVFTGRLPEVYP